MKDKDLSAVPAQADKTKEQLIDELTGMRRRIAEFKALESERKRVEKLNLESEEELKAIFDSVRDGIALLDMTGKVIKVNKRIVDVGGYSEEEIVGKRIKLLKMFTPPSIAKILSAFTKIILGKHVPPHEVELYTKKGERLNVEIHSSLLRKRGKVMGVVAIMRDITEYKRSEQKLLESEKRFSDIAENALEWIWEIDTDGKYTYASPVVEKILGYKPEEVLKKHFYDLFHPQDRQELKKAAFEVFAKKQSFREFINRNVHKDGKTVWLSTSGVPMLDKKGNLLGYRGADTDITERKQTDAALKQSEERYRTLVEESFDGIFVQKGPKIIFTNQRLNEMLGYEEDELLGLDHWLVYHPDYQELTRQRAQARMRGEKVTSQYEVKLQRKDGSWLYGEVSARVISFEGEPGVQVWVRDITERKRGEEALKESEERYRTLFEGSRDAIYITTREGKFIDANQSTLDLFGYTREEMRGLKAHKLYSDPKDSRKFQKEVEQKGFVRDYDVKLRKKDGAEMDCLFNVSVRRADDGSILGYYGIIRDITERKRAEEALRESEEKYRNILESIEDGYFEVDIKGNLTFFNNALCNRLKYSKDELMGMNNREYTDEKNAKRLFETFNKVYTTGKPGTLRDYEVIAKDGTVRILETPVSLIKDNKGKPIGFRGLARDITERKQAEAELIQTKNFLQNIYDSSIDGINTTDLHGNIIYASPRSKDILGYEQEEIIGKKVYSLYENGKEDAKTIMKEITEKGELRDHEMKLIKKDGKLIDINLSTSLLRNEKGEITGTLGIYRDITEKKKLEAQLRYAQRMESIGTLAGGIAHNFNNLLMGIQGNASLMLLDTDSDHPNYERLTNIEKMVQSGSKLTSQLLGYARGGRYEVRSISLNQLVKETSDTFDITRKDITVHQELDKDLFGIIADQGQIEQVLLNLYVNAADAMPQGGDLFLKTMNVTHEDIKDKPYTPRPGNYALLTVRDTGIGMDKETIERIFEPFFTTKGLAKGTGLGLASVYGIIKAHGGYIDVYSEKGHGTTFYIYLPASEEKEVIEKEKLPEEVSKGKETVLLVDDEEMILDVGSQLLEKLGYKVLVAGSGKEAIEFYKANKDKIDMVILDMIMPEMGGGETYDRMKEINPDIKVLLSSGYSIDGQATEILKRGCSGFIQKPFSMEELSKSIREVLGS